MNPIPYVLTYGEQIKTRPSDITTEGHLWDAFGNHETEISARYIVRLCQQRDNWTPFTINDIEEVYNDAGNYGYTFNRLISDGWIVEENGYYYITVGFVERVLHSTLLAQYSERESAQ